MIVRSVAGSFVGSLNNSCNVVPLWPPLQQATIAAVDDDNDDDGGLSWWQSVSIDVYEENVGP